MTELEMCDALGILLDPDQNAVTIDQTILENIAKVSRALVEVSDQKALLGTLNQEMWLAFVPWHSFN
jgi:hypothetical protein